MKLRIHIIFALFIAICIPVLSHAASYEISDILKEFASILKIVFGLAYAAAAFFFFWGVAKFIAASGDENAHTEAKRFMIWSLIALFVIWSIGAIISFVQSDLGVSSDPGSVSNLLSIPEQNNVPGQ